MKKWLGAVLLGTLLVLGACGGDSGGSSDSSSENGGTSETEAAEALFAKSCAGCHGKDLSGTSGPDLRKVGSTYSADEILDIIENGKGSMQGGYLTGDDAAEVADWLAEKK